MRRFPAVVMLTGMAIAQLSLAGAKPEQMPGAQSGSMPDTASRDLSALPPVPPGKSTVIGGEIRGLDPVRDQFMLTVFGGRPMKILFDERTEVYRDGQRTSLRDLRSDDRASVETVLDGANVFALSIHMLSRTPEGECQGQVLKYNPESRELTVNDALSRGPIKLRVPAGTAFVRAAQAASSSGEVGPSNLVKGTLISVRYESDNQGRGIASQIAILATPGSAFVFSGNVAFLDVPSGELVLLDPHDGKNYKIFFDSGRFPMSRDIHEGSHVTVTANFDGARYVANALKLD